MISRTRTYNDWCFMFSFPTPLQPFFLHSCTTRCPPVARATPQFLEQVLARNERLNSSGTQCQLTTLISPALSLCSSVLLNELLSKIWVLVLVTCVLFCLGNMPRTLVLQRNSYYFKLKFPNSGRTSRVVQWLWLHAPNSGDTVSIPGWGRSHMPCDAAKKKKKKKMIVRK